MTTPTLPSTNALFNQTGPDHEFIAMTTPSLTETTILQLQRDLAARDAELAEWKRKAEEAARDAARYGWVRSSGGLYWSPTGYVKASSELDAAIDAALAAKGEA